MSFSTFKIANLVTRFFRLLWQGALPQNRPLALLIFLTTIIIFFQENYNYFHPNRGNCVILNSKSTFVVVAVTPERPIICLLLEIHIRHLRCTVLLSIAHRLKSTITLEIHRVCYPHHLKSTITLEIHRVCYP